MVYSGANENRAEVVYVTCLFRKWLLYMRSKLGLTMVYSHLQMLHLLTRVESCIPIDNPRKPCRSPAWGLHLVWFSFTKNSDMFGLAY